MLVPASLTPLSCLFHTIHLPLYPFRLSQLLPHQNLVITILISSIPFFTLSFLRGKTHLTASPPLLCSLLLLLLTRHWAWNHDLEWHLPLSTPIHTHPAIRTIMLLALLRRWCRRQHLPLPLSLSLPLTTALRSSSCRTSWTVRTRVVGKIHRRGG
jgi:hypothetical protein